MADWRPDARNLRVNRVFGCCMDGALQRDGKMCEGMSVDNSSLATWGLLC